MLVRKLVFCLILCLNLVMFSCCSWSNTCLSFSQKMSLESPFFFIGASCVFIIKIWHQQACSIMYVVPSLTYVTLIMADMNYFCFIWPILPLNVAVYSEPDLNRLFTFQVPYLVSIFLCTGQCKESLWICESVMCHSVLFFMARVFLTPCLPSDWRTTLYWLCVTGCWIYLQLPPLCGSHLHLQPEDGPWHGVCGTT